MGNLAVLNKYRGSFERFYIPLNEVTAEVSKAMVGYMQHGYALTISDDKYVLFNLFKDCETVKVGVYSCNVKLRQILVRSGVVKSFMAVSIQEYSKNSVIQTAIDKVLKYFSTDDNQIDYCAVVLTCDDKGNFRFTEVEGLAAM